MVIHDAIENCPLWVRVHIIVTGKGCCVKVDGRSCRSDDIIEFEGAGERVGG